MCGKFTQLASWEEVSAFSLPLTAAPADAPVTIATPMRFARVLHLNEAGARALTPMRWGFADHRAEHPAAPKYMHARSETIDARPAFMEAFAARRGILFVHTFNEGETLASGKTKQWVIAPKDKKPLAIAVIVEVWERGEERLLTFVMVTTPPNALIAAITDRMPAILRAEHWPLWLGETGASLTEVKAVLGPHDDAGAWDMAPQTSPARARKQGARQANLL